jgi:hypothetical protein
MTDFAKANPVKNNFWGETDDLSLSDAALLTLNIEPSALGDQLEASGEPLNSDELPKEFFTRIEVLRSAIRAEKLSTVALITDKHGRIDESKTRIKTDDFVIWCAAKRFAHNIPNRVAPQPTTKWPWGDYETKLLKKLAVAAEEWWSDYDQKNPGSAPTNDDVRDWLVGQGVSKRVAEVMAQILRADGLQPGPRK